MKLKVKRNPSKETFTTGKLSIDGKHICYTLEDEKREVKVIHETRIPEGLYEIKLRTFGGHHEKYKVKFPFHKGMLWLQNVPNFKDILIHIGNTEKDTSGCILIGKTVDEVKGTVGQSTVAYTELYKIVEAELSKGNKVFIEIE